MDELNGGGSGERERMSAERADLMPVSRIVMAMAARGNKSKINTP